MNKENAESAAFIITTDRLFLRTFKSVDAYSLFRLNNDPEVLKYTGDPPFKNEEEARQFVLNYSHYQQYGLGRWAVIARVDQAFLGWCGIKYSAESNEYDIGFRFFKKYWNKGYATESAAACLQFASKLGIFEVVGRANKKNLASIRVLEKLGMRYVGEILFDGNPGVKYIVKTKTHRT